MRVWEVWGSARKLDGWVETVEHDAGFVES
jgi:hypothetical protein